MVKDGSSFLNSGETLASFHVSGQTHCIKEQLKRSHKGWDRGVASSFRILLFIVSGPDDFPNFKVCRTEFTSAGVIDILFKKALSWVTVSVIVAFWSSKIVWATKKSFKILALSKHSE